MENYRHIIIFMLFESLASSEFKLSVILYIVLILYLRSNTIYAEFLTENSGMLLPLAVLVYAVVFVAFKKLGGT